MNSIKRRYLVVVGSDRDGRFEEAFDIQATYPKAAEFDAKLEAAKRFPFMADSLFIISTRQA